MHDPRPASTLTLHDSSTYSSRYVSMSRCMGSFLSKVIGSLFTNQQCQSNIKLRMISKSYQRRDKSVIDIGVARTRRS
jgi:hypothetical protein